MRPPPEAMAVSSANPGEVSEKPQRSNVGRQIDEWTFRMPGEPDVPIKIMMVGTGAEKLFRATCDWLEKGKPVENTDIVLLRADVEAAVLARAQAHRRIEWEPWLEVSVQGSVCGQRLHTEHANFELGVRNVLRGIDKTTGDVYLSDADGRIGSFRKMPRAQSLHEQTIMERGFTLEQMAQGECRDIPWDKKEVAYIAATEANLAAIADLQRRIVDLKLRLAQLLSQDNLQQTLLEVASHMNLLPGPTSDAGEQTPPARPRP